MGLDNWVRCDNLGSAPAKQVNSSWLSDYFFQENSLAESKSYQPSSHPRTGNLVRLYNNNLEEQPHSYPKEQSNSDPKDESNSYPKAATTGPHKVQFVENDNLR